VQVAQSIDIGQMMSVKEPVHLVNLFCFFSQFCVAVSLLPMGATKQGGDKFKSDLSFVAA